MWPFRRSTLTKAIAAAQPPSVGSLIFFGLQGDEKAKIDSHTHPFAYQQNPCVYAAVSTIADCLRRVDWLVEAKQPSGRWAPATGQKGAVELARFLSWCNASDDPARVKADTISALLVTGNAYWYLLRATAAGMPVGMQVLPASNCKPVRDRRTGNLSYEIGRGVGQAQKEPPANILHAKLWNPLGTDLGMSPIAPLEQTLNTFSALMNFNYLYLKGGGVPAFAIWAKDEPLTDSQADEIRAVWSEQRGEGRNAGAPFVTSGRDLVIQKLGGSPDQQLAGGALDRHRDTVYSVYRTPQSTVGVPAANYATASVEAKSLWEEAVIPPATVVSDALNSQLVPQFGDPEILRVRWAWERVPALQIDKTAAVEAGVRACGVPVMSPNQARDMFLDLEPVDGGDELMVPLNMVSANAPPAPSSPPPQGQVPPSPSISIPTPETTRPGEPAGSAPAQPPYPKPRQKARLTDGHKDARYAAVNQLRGEREKAVWTSTARWYSARAQTVTSRLEANPGPLARSSKAIVVKAGTIDEWLGDEDEWAETLAVLLVPQAIATFTQATEQALNHLGVAVPDSVSARAYRYATTRDRALRGMAVDAQGEVRSIVADGIATGATLQEMAAAVAAYAVERSAGYAWNVARTETGDALSRAREESFKEANVPGREWRSAMLPRSREGHSKLHGTVVRAGETFSLETVLADPRGIVEVQGPYDETLTDGDKCNCACIVIEAFEEDLPAQEGG
jgi:phage portal protein BeeE